MKKIINQINLVIEVLTNPVDFEGDESSGNLL